MIWAYFYPLCNTPSHGFEKKLLVLKFTLKYAIVDEKKVTCFHISLVLNQPTVTEDKCQKQNFSVISIYVKILFWLIKIRILFQAWQLHWGFFPKESIFYPFIELICTHWQYIYIVSENHYISAIKSRRNLNVQFSLHLFLICEILKNT